MAGLISISGETVLKTLKQLLRIYDKRQLRDKYLLFYFSDGTICCGRAVNPNMDGLESCELEELESKGKIIIPWDTLTDRVWVHDSKKEASYAIEKMKAESYREEFEKQEICGIKTPEGFYLQSEKIQKICPNVRVLAKTPGLIMPKEANSDPFRVHYFETIKDRLGNDHYNLMYLFDYEKFKSYLSDCHKFDKLDQIDKSREMLSSVLGFRNLDLRCGRTDPLTGLVIGGDEIACVGFNDGSSFIAKGVSIRSSDLLKIYRFMYDNLFNEASKVEEDFIDIMLQRIVE